jgi:hypothetical protein
MLIKWNYPFVKNIETLKLRKKRHFARNELAQSKIVPREAFLIVDNPAFFPFFVKKQKKRLQKKCHLLNLWLNFGEYRFLCFPD